MIAFDIDIDFQTNFNPTKIIKQAIPASMIKNNELVKHNCGHYFQTMPVDQYTGVAAIPYEEANVLGFFKIDFLHLSTLDRFATKTEIRELVKKEPDWSLLQDPDQVVKLSQVKNHADILKLIKPTSAMELADATALIRPGKRHLLHEYIQDRERVREKLYTTGQGGYSYKKPHALAYALTIVLELHLIAQGRL